MISLSVWFSPTTIGGMLSNVPSSIKIRDVLLLFFLFTPDNVCMFLDFFFLFYSRDKLVDCFNIFIVLNLCRDFTS